MVLGRYIFAGKTVQINFWRDIMAKLLHFQELNNNFPIDVIQQDEGFLESRTNKTTSLLAYNRERRKYVSLIKAFFTVLMNRNNSTPSQNKGYSLFFVFIVFHIILYWSHTCFRALYEQSDYVPEKRLSNQLAAKDWVTNLLNESKTWSNCAPPFQKRQRIAFSQDESHCMTRGRQIWSDSKMHYFISAVAVSKHEWSSQLLLRDCDERDSSWTWYCYA